MRDSISIIATRSSLLVCCYMLSLSVICYRQKLDKSKSLPPSHLRCLPFVCIIGVVLVFSFLYNRFIFSQVNDIFCNAFFLVQFPLYFLLVRTTQPQSLLRSSIRKYFSALSSTIIKDHFTFNLRLNCLSSRSVNLLKLHVEHQNQTKHDICEEERLQESQSPSKGF